MPDILDGNGLQTKNYNEIEMTLKNGFKRIYGEDINLDSNTQDGELIGILTQFNIDIRELNTEIYNSFNPKMCRGIVQDSRFLINGITRKGGSFTVQPVTLTVDRTITLQGLDEDYNDINGTSYTVGDNSGSQWFLIDTSTLEKGTHTLPFRAKEIGLVQPTVGTITNQVTTNIAVKSVINDVAPTSYGIEQETDEQFATRRETSHSTKGQNNIDSTKAQLLDLPGVNFAQVYANIENDPISLNNNIPLHYVWAIVEGGANSDIAQTLYANCSGNGLKGDISIDVPTMSGQVFKVKFSRPNVIPLFLKFDLQETEPNVTLDIASIKSYIQNNLIYQPNEFAETSKPTNIARNAIQANCGLGVPTNFYISTDGLNWSVYIPNISIADIFVVDTSRIQINEINYGV